VAGGVAMGVGVGVGLPWAGTGDWCWGFGLRARTVGWDRGLELLASAGGQGKARGGGGRAHYTHCGRLGQGPGSWAGVWGSIAYLCLMIIAGAKGCAEVLLFLSKSLDG